MKSILFKKIKESLISVFPVAALVLFLSMTPLVNLTPQEIFVFLASAFFLIVGISLFNLGADLAMTPMGEHIGAGLTKTKSLTILLTVCFAMGLLITVAEPDLSVLATQVASIDSTLLIMTIGIGVGLFLAIALLRMLTGITVQRKIAGDFPQKGGQLFGFLRRNGFPCTDVGIVDAFLGVLRRAENIAGDAPEKAAVFFLGFLERKL